MVDSGFENNRQLHRGSIPRTSFNRAAIFAVRSGCTVMRFLVSPGTLERFGVFERGGFFVILPAVRGNVCVR